MSIVQLLWVKVLFQRVLLDFLSNLCITLYLKVQILPEWAVNALVGTCLIELVVMASH